MSFPLRNPTADSVQWQEEEQIRTDYGCEACTLAGTHAGECLAENILDTRGFCNGWVMDVDWRRPDA